MRVAHRRIEVAQIHEASAGPGIHIPKVPDVHRVESLPPGIGILVCNECGAVIGIMPTEDPYL